MSDPTPEAIAQARLDADLTQIQLAARVGVHQTTVSWWETGRSRPRGQRLRRLAFALARPHWLAGTQPDSQPDEQPPLLHRDDLAIACPGCGQERGYVKDSRPSPTGIRRRRECSTCGHRWTTREIPDAMVPNEAAEDKVVESLIAALRTLGVEVSVLGRARDQGAAAEGSR